MYSSIIISVCIHRFSDENSTSLPNMRAWFEFVFRNSFRHLGQTSLQSWSPHPIHYPNYSPFPSLTTPTLYCVSPLEKGLNLHTTQRKCVYIYIYLNNVCDCYMILFNEYYYARIIIFNIGLVWMQSFWGSMLAHSCLWSNTVQRYELPHWYLIVSFVVYKDHLCSWYSKAL